MRIHLPWVPLVFALCGCGTVYNLGGGLVDPQHEVRNYGGTQMELQAVASIAGGKSVGVTDPRIGLAFLGIFGVEVAATVVGDTVTFPITNALQRPAAGAFETSQSAKASIGFDTAVNHADTCTREVDRPIEPFHSTNGPILRKFGPSGVAELPPASVQYSFFSLNARLIDNQ